MAAARKFFQRPAADRRLLLHATLLHAAIAAGCRMLPLPVLARLLERAYPRSGGKNTVDDRILWAAATAAAWWPAAGTCLSHALTAHCLLRRRGCDTALRIGVRKDRGTTLDSHAWLERAGTVIVGDNASAYLPIWGN